MPGSGIHAIRPRDDIGLCKIHRGGEDRVGKDAPCELDLTHVDIAAGVFEGDQASANVRRKSRARQERWVRRRRAGQGQPDGAKTVAAGVCSASIIGRPRNNFSNSGRTTGDIGSEPPDVVELVVDSGREFDPCGIWVQRFLQH